MAYRIADRNAELLYQTGDREFRMKLDNGVEVNVDVDAIELVADVDLVETGRDSDGTIVLAMVAR